MDRVRSRHQDKPSTVFVVGSGQGGYSHELTAKHDQTGAYLGEYKQYGEIHIKDGKVVQKMMVKGRKIPTSAPVQVYK
jgi:pyruvate/2-oxoglutarate dehydrogenase complex dihydrolipoamide dehydrogenase (E3) component